MMRNKYKNEIIQLISFSKVKTNPYRRGYIAENNTANLISYLEKKGFKVTIPDPSRGATNNKVSSGIPDENRLMPPPQFDFSEQNNEREEKIKNKKVIDL